jgi:hypothetical protein
MIKSFFKVYENCIDNDYNSINELNQRSENVLGENP